MSELFPKLVPPPGGLARLRARLAEEVPVHRWRPLLWLAPTVTAAAAGAWLLLALQPRPLGPEHALALDIAMASAEPVSAVPGDEHPPILQRLPSGDAKLILYAVAPTADLEAR